jgi:apolipoprotein N-acyltransferase
MKSILQVFYAIFSSVLLSLAIPNELYPMGCPFYAFLALIPYYIAIKNSKSYKEAFWLGFTQTITTHLLSSFWLAFFRDFAVFTLGASAIATGFIGAFMALLLYLPFSRNQAEKLSKFALCKKFYQNETFRVFYFAAIYTFYEYVKSNGFLGYPWGTVSSAMYTFPIFTQIADITGTYGITFLTVLFNASCVEALDLIKTYKTVDNEYQKTELLSNHIITGKFLAVIFSLTIVYGIVQYNIPRTPVKELTTITVQQNTDPWEVPYDEMKNIEISEKLSMEKVNELTDQGKNPGLIVWSEGTLMTAFPNAENLFTHAPESLPLKSFIQMTGTPLITGASYRHTLIPLNQDEQPLRRLFNSTLLFNSNGTFLGYYAKLHLVPFAELIPGKRNPIVKKLLRKIINFSSGWDKGDSLTYFDIPCTKLKNYADNPLKIIDAQSDLTDKDQNAVTKVRVATPVCFDDSFTDAMRPLFLNGAELFINLSDDSWSCTKSSEIQHFVIASYRSIEYRTTMIRSTNAGFSCVIDPTGKILSSLPLFKACAQSYDVPVYARKLTLYARLGDWLPLLCIAFFLVSAWFMYKSFTKTDYIPFERKKRHYK